MLSTSWAILMKPKGFFSSDQRPEKPTIRSSASAPICRTRASERGIGRNRVRSTPLLINRMRAVPSPRAVSHSWTSSFSTKIKSMRSRRRRLFSVVT